MYEKHGRPGCSDSKNSPGTHSTWQLVKCSHSQGLCGAHSSSVLRGGLKSRSLGGWLTWNYPAGAGSRSRSRSRFPGCCSVLVSPWKACPDCVCDLISASASRFRFEICSLSQDDAGRLEQPAGQIIKLPLCVISNSYQFGESFILWDLCIPFIPSS